MSHRQVVKLYGSRKHHLMQSAVSTKTICGKDVGSSSLLTPDDAPFNFCQKCWIHIGKEMVNDYLGISFWARLKEQYESINKQTKRTVE